MLDTTAIGQAATAEHDADAFITRRLRAHFGSFDISNTEHRLAWTACVSAWKAAGGFVPQRRIPDKVPEHVTADVVWNLTHVRALSYERAANALDIDRPTFGKWAIQLGFVATRGRQAGLLAAAGASCGDSFRPVRAQVERVCEACASEMAEAA